MSAMSNLATELECYWTRYTDLTGCVHYFRRLPDGGDVTIYENGRMVAIDLRGKILEQQHDTLIGAMRAAGRIARQQLQWETTTWM